MFKPQYDNEIGLLRFEIALIPGWKKLRYTERNHVCKKSHSDKFKIIGH